MIRKQLFIHDTSLPENAFDGLKKLPQAEPKDVLSRLILPKETILVQTVVVREMPVIHADIGIGERLVFYVRKVIPYVYDVLRFYFPLPPLFKETTSMNAKEKSSTGLGIAAILTAVASVLNALMDGDPSTVPDWATVISSVVAGVGMIFSRFRQ